MDGDLSGLFWVFVLVFAVVGAIVAAVVSVVGGAIYLLVRPRRGFRALTAMAALWTAGCSLLGAQLLRLAVNGSLTSKGDGWFGPVILGLVLGIAALAAIVRVGRKHHPDLQN